MSRVMSKDTARMFAGYVSGNSSFTAKSVVSVPEMIPQPADSNSLNEKIQNSCLRYLYHDEPVLQKIRLIKYLRQRKGNDDANKFVTRQFLSLSNLREFKT